MREGQDGIWMPTSCPSSHINAFIDHYCCRCSLHPDFPREAPGTQAASGKTELDSIPTAHLVGRAGDSWQKLGGRSIWASPTWEYHRECYSTLYLTWDQETALIKVLPL